MALWKVNTKAKVGARTTVHPKPAPEPTFRREKTLALGMLALLAPVPLGFSFTLDWPVLFVYFAALGALLAAAARGRVLTLSNTVVNLTALAYLVLFTADIRHGGRGLLKSALHLLLFVTLMKLAAVRRDRDFSMVLALVGFIFLTSVATSYHYAIALYIAVFLLAAWPVLVRWALWRDLSGAPDEWHRDPHAGRLPGARATVTSVAAAILLAAPIFFALPRLKAPFVKGVGAESREITTGIAETVDPEVFGTLKRSEQVYMRITSEGSLVSPVGEPVRIRVIAFSRYEGKTWQKPSSPGATLSGKPGGFQGLVREDRIALGQRQLMSVDLSPLGNRYLPYPVEGTAIRISDQTLRQMNLFYVDMDDAKNVRLPFEPERTLHYDATFGGPPTPDLREPSQRDSTRLPLGSPRIKEFTLGLLEGVDARTDPDRAAHRIEAALGSRLGFEYSVEIPRSGPNPVEDFLFQRRTGHCETFATAMTLMMREVGVPARFVTGFVGGEVGLFGQYMIVRGHNAHAWVEVWCGPGQGWKTFDPTPAAGRPVFEHVPIGRRLRQVADGVEFFYDRYVLSFGQSEQEEFLKLLREKTAALLEAMQRNLQDAAQTVKRLPVRVLVAAASGLGLLMALVLTLIRAARRSGTFFGTRSLPPASRAYRSLQRALRRRGAPLTPASAPAETLQAAAMMSDDARTLSREIVRAYVAESFGGVEGGPEEATRLEDLSRRALAEIRKAPRAA